MAPIKVLGSCTRIILLISIADRQKGMPNVDFWKYFVSSVCLGYTDTILFRRFIKNSLLIKTTWKIIVWGRQTARVIDGILKCSMLLVKCWESESLCLMTWVNREKVQVQSHKRLLFAATEALVAFIFEMKGKAERTFRCLIDFFRSKFHSLVIMLSRNRKNTIKVKIDSFPICLFSLFLLSAGVVHVCSRAVLGWLLFGSSCRLYNCVTCVDCMM